MSCDLVAVAAELHDVPVAHIEEPLDLRRRRRRRARTDRRGAPLPRPARRVGSSPRRGRGKRGGRAGGHVSPTPPPTETAAPSPNCKGSAAPQGVRTVRHLRGRRRQPVRNLHWQGGVVRLYHSLARGLVLSLVVDEFWTAGGAGIMGKLGLFG